MKVNFLGIDVEIEKFKGDTVFLGDKVGVEYMNIQTCMGLGIGTQETCYFDYQDRTIILSSMYPVENITKSETFDGEEYTLEFNSFEDKLYNNPRITCLLKYK